MTLGVPMQSTVKRQAGKICKICQSLDIKPTLAGQTNAQK